MHKSHQHDLTNDHLFSLFSSSFVYFYSIFLYVLCFSYTSLLLLS